MSNFINAFKNAKEEHKLEEGNAPSLQVDNIASNHTDETNTFAKERYDVIVRRADKLGIKILTKWRKGLKNIRVAPIVLGEW